MNLAQRIASSFGGVRSLWRALTPVFPDLDPMTVYRWTYPTGEPHRGTGGHIPRSRLRAIVEIATLRGIDLNLTLDDILGG